MPNTAQIKGSNVPQKTKNRSRISKRQRHRRRNKQKLLNNQNKAPNPPTTQIPFSQSAHKRGAEVWSEAYINAVRWHGEHQNNFWRHAAEQLQNENQMLRQELQYVANIKPETQQQYYETSDEEETIAVKKEEEEEEDEIDSKYLEFLQVTIKHREELRLKREAEDLLEEEEEEGSTTGTVD